MFKRYSKDLHTITVRKEKWTVIFLRVLINIIKYYKNDECITVTNVIQNINIIQFIMKIYIPNTLYTSFQNFIDFVSARFQAIIIY